MDSSHFFSKMKLKVCRFNTRTNGSHVESIPNAFVVNVGDHLEIFSNGKYESVLHRVKVNSTKSRISVASLHTLPFKCMVRPWSKLIDAANPRRYKDTNFVTFLDYISTRDPKNKEFLDSRKLNFEQIHHIHKWVMMITEEELLRLL
ncbi:hypothetical protein GH714_038846 [Hevea brasiliensis]|uniref:Isopenicillin N synthase-like Fe(2+) 2OG dioxygenase domain-containing protein n=1 Tax=Hevea brasiliensis TaxID=3981 RepID=A0A6A6KQW1_HEVBR|nr:hypothetical protein GH714_038846 [Hevea brasiliensis]